VEHTIVTMPGDGIGRIVLPEALRVLDAVGFRADYIHADIGWDCWVKDGNTVPERTIELVAKHKIGLLGAITSKTKSEANAELSPKLRGKGYVYRSPVITLRQQFELDICVRPCRSLLGNPLNFTRRTTQGGYEEPVIDVVIFRQNTEGLYCGVEWTGPPSGVREALNIHPRMKSFADVPGEDLAVSLRVLSRRSCRRIITAAFDYAERFGYKSVTICEKPNVLRETSGMMVEEARKVSKDYPGIENRFTNIDAQMMWLTKNPEDYDVIATTNLFGDILSDAFAGLVGGLGFAGSANIGEEVAIFEPTHGSAPKYANLHPSIVNPIGIILSACMMLEHLGEMEKSERIINGLREVVAEGKVRTYDMLRLSGGPDVVKQGAATTAQMTDAIINKL